MLNCPRSHLNCCRVMAQSKILVMGAENAISKLDDDTWQILSKFGVRLHEAVGIGFISVSNCLDCSLIDATLPHCLEILFWNVESRVLDVVLLLQNLCDQCQGWTDVGQDFFHALAHIRARREDHDHIVLSEVVRKDLLAGINTDFNSTASKLDVSLSLSLSLISRVLVSVEKQKHGQFVVCIEFALKCRHGYRNVLPFSCIEMLPRILKRSPIHLH